MERMLNKNFFSIAGNPQNVPGFRQDCSSPPYNHPITLQTIHSLDKQIIQQVATRLGLTFINQTEATGEVCFANEPGLRPEFRQSFTPVDLLDYIYAVLHNNNKYDEFLKAGLAQVPYPTSAEDFWKMVQTGNRLR